MSSKRQRKCSCHLGQHCDNCTKGRSGDILVRVQGTHRWVELRRQIKVKKKNAGNKRPAQPSETSSRDEVASEMAAVMHQIQLDRLSMQLR